jgi:hypothetical protein
MHVHTCAHTQARRLKEFHTLRSRRQQPSKQQRIRDTCKTFNGKGDEEEDGPVEFEEEEDGPVEFEEDEDGQRVEVVPRVTARFLAQRSLREAETAQWLERNVSVANAV